MDNSAFMNKYKKFKFDIFAVIKKTTSTQFAVLARQFEANPDLARGAPTFGAGRVTVDEQWRTIAAKVNSYGPPQRSAMEWKKIWADLKSRTKKKIAENNASMQATGGGPFQCVRLTEIEQTIERVLLMSTAAAPTGKILGFRSLQSPAQTTTISTTHTTTAHPTTAHPTTAHPTTAHPTTAHPTTALTTSEHPTTSNSTTEHPTNSHPTTAPIIETGTTPTRQSPTVTTFPSPRQPTQIGVVTPTRATPNAESPNTATPNHQRRCYRKKKSFQEIIGESAREQAKAAKEMAAASKMQAEATKSIAQTLAQLVDIQTRQTAAFEEFTKFMKNT